MTRAARMLRGIDEAENIIPRRSHDSLSIDVLVGYVGK